jgi:hypothetical protein
MDAMTICTVVVGIWAADLPTLELRALAKQVDLPAGAVEKWDAIGTYTIEQRKATAIVKLYYADSDSIADKEKRKGGVGSKEYPNHFEIYAVYRNGMGPWKHKKICGRWRIGFSKVVDVKPDAVTLQVVSKFIFWANRPNLLTNEQIERIYEPQSIRLTLKDGVPELK